MSTTQLLMPSSLPKRVEPSEIEELREIKVVLKKNGGKQKEGSNPVDNGEYDGRIVTLTVTPEDYHYLIESKRYMDSINIDAKNCTAEELNEWNRKFTRHWGRIDEIFAEALAAGCIPGNYTVLATIGFGLI